MKPSDQITFITALVVLSTGIIVCAGLVAWWPWLTLPLVAFIVGFVAVAACYLPPMGPPR